MEITLKLIKYSNLVFFCFRGRIPPILKNLYAPHLAAIDRAIQPGFIKLTWTSVNVQEYLKKVHAQLGKKTLKLHLRRSVKNDQIFVGNERFRPLMLGNVCQQSPNYR